MVLDIGGGNDGMSHHALGIDRNVTLPAFDLLAGVIAMRIDAGTALLGSLDALGIDDGRAWAGLARGLFPAFDIQRWVDALQRAVPAPAVEAFMDRAARRQVFGTRPPLGNRS